LYLKADEFDNLNRGDYETKLAEKAFDLLSAKCKKLLHLFYFQKQSLKNIALALKFSSEKVIKN